VVMRFQDDVRDVHHVHHLYSRRRGTAEPPKDIDRSVGPCRPTYEEIGLFVHQCPDVMHNGEHCWANLGKFGVAQQSYFPPCPG
jgi:hypothetical protein